MVCGLSVVIAVVVSGCVTTTVGSSNGDPPQCTADTDCAGFDTDQDLCTTAACVGGNCTQRLIKNTTECQCQSDADCTYYEKDCSRGTCTGHECAEKIEPAGPAPKQEAGDCSVLMCDGTSVVATKKDDPTDLPPSTPCIVATCEASGPKQTSVADGTSCGDGSVCFVGSCLACKPTNAESCGSEGGDEPKNNAGTTASSFAQETPFCAFSSGTDIDLYTFFAKDADFSHDVFSFKLWSTAPSIEVCIYVSCEKGGIPEGGCTTKVPGPNGSQGCCWTGAPSTLQPTWDLDCPGTTEDSGTAYVSVRAPGGDACETYAMTGGY